MRDFSLTKGYGVPSASSVPIVKSIPPSVDQVFNYLEARLLADPEEKNKPQC